MADTVANIFTPIVLAIALAALSDGFSWPSTSAGTRNHFKCLSLGNCVPVCYRPCYSMSIVVGVGRAAREGLIQRRKITQLDKARAS